MRSRRRWLSAAKEAGAEIRTSCEVVSIKVKDGAAVGVVLANGDEIDARTVISNADPKRTLLGLVEPNIWSRASCKSFSITA